ncbi:MAG TPA: hypothetical protein VMS75_02880 [Terriglobales bacterium]|nr:hypothetical protein [Terriglobales bacterium]
MKRVWGAVAILLFLSGIFAQEARFSSPASRTRFRKPLPQLYPYALAEAGTSDILRQVGLTPFASRPAPLYNLIAGQKRADFTRVVGAGVQMGAARRLALFLEFRYFAGLVLLARAALPHAEFLELRLRPMALQAGFRFLPSR